MRIDTGEYRVDFFDKYGGRLKLLEDKATSLAQGINKGNHAVTNNPEVSSFTIVRQVYNSLDGSIL